MTDLTIIDYFLNHLHSSLDNGNLPEAEATLSNLLMFARQDGSTWTDAQRETFSWLYGLFLACCFE